MATARILEKVVLPETTMGNVALAVHDEQLWLGWIGQNNEQLNVMGGTLGPVGDPHFDWRLKQTMGDISPYGCALHSFAGKLWIAWTGQDNGQLNVMGSVHGNDFDTGTKQVMGDISDAGPALAVHLNRLWIGWIGHYNHQINVMGSRNGNDFDTATKQVLGERSDGPVSLGPFVGGGLGLCWTGTDGQVNLMRSQNGDDFDLRTKVTLAGTQPSDGAGLALFVSQWIAVGTPNGPLLVKVDRGPDGLVADVAQIIDDEFFFGPPALVSYQGRVVIAWAGTDDDHHLNVGYLGLF